MALALIAGTASTAGAATKIERLVSPAGIEVWFVRDDTLPILSLNFAFTGGSSQDPADRAGLAYMAAALLDEGAGDLDAKAFQERIENRAISLSFSADRDHFRGSLRVLSEHRSEAFELLRLALNAPRFDQEAIDRIRASVLASLRRNANDPGEIAAKQWFAKAFPNHPYGRPVQGDETTIAGVERSMLFAYVKKNLSRSNLKVAVVGSIDRETLLGLIDQVFAKLPAAADLVPVIDATPQALGENEIIDLNIPQTTITFGGIGLKRKDPDFMPAFVLNHILGGGSFSSRLYREVREKRGLAYSVYSYLSTLRNAGLFFGGTQTRNDRAMEAWQIIEAEIRRIANEGPSDDELKQAKSYLTGSYLLNFDTSAKVASQLLEIQLNDLGIDYIDRRNDMVNAVTAEDVRRVANRFLRESKFLVLMVGRPAPLAKPKGG